MQLFDYGCATRLQGGKMAVFLWLAIEWCWRRTSSSKVLAGLLHSSKVAEFNAGVSKAWDRLRTCSNSFTSRQQAAGGRDPGLLVLGSGEASARMLNSKGARLLGRGSTKQQQQLCDGGRSSVAKHAQQVRQQYVDGEEPPLSSGFQQGERGQYL